MVIIEGEGGGLQNFCKATNISYLWLSVGEDFLVVAAIYTAVIFLFRFLLDNLIIIIVISESVIVESWRVL